MKADLLEFIQQTGVEMKYLFNGFIGALVWSLYKKLRFAEALRQIFIGSIVAGYVTPLIAFKEAIPLQYMAALSFVVGMMGMVIIDSIYKYIINKVKQLRKGKETIMREEIADTPIEQI
jgi:uncharacterized membrane protein YeaQ/YmgE (transglycosylase-associated protein family)